MLVRVAVLLPVDKTFDYELPSSLAPARVGMRVWVPWGTRAIEGVVVVVAPTDSPADLRVKTVRGLVDALAITTELIELARWTSEYYLAPLGEVLRLCLPAGGKARSRRLVALTDEGRRAATAATAALQPPWLDALGLSDKELQLLASLDAGNLDTNHAEPLVQRGFAVIVEQVSTQSRRVEVWLRPGRTPEAGELDRAPKQRALWQAVSAHGDAASIEQLRQELGDPRVGDHARPLVAAGLLLEERRASVRDPFDGDVPVPDAPPAQLTDGQAAALTRLLTQLETRSYAPFLLHGVTGSGKTEVYLQLIAVARQAGRRALVLVPEISLTPQLAARFRARFGTEIAVLHSALSDAQRADAWRRIHAGEVGIVVGARSAVFAPIADLGVVIVDEEHDPSFKQQEGVRYHGRDVALRRARAVGAVAVLGSATPSLETYTAAQEGRLQLLSLPGRANLRPLPSVQVIDLRSHQLADDSLLSAVLARAVKETLEAGEQSILFLNRRGFSTFLLCKTCGKGVRCPHCAVTLTFHRGHDRAVCHYCDYRVPPPRRCPTCNAAARERLGVGTEQLEQQIKTQFPTARVARLDRDTAEGPGLIRVLDGMRRGEIDIVVGTQMLTKGHDFPGVTLVGVLLADQGMGLPDFRASERSFQLLEQVAGRAGRGDRPGRVIMQTYQPEHPAVQCARDHDYARFAALELAARRELDYPPAARVACIHIDGADGHAVRQVATQVAAECRRVAGNAPSDERAAVLGPAEAPLSRLKGRTRWQVFCKAQTAHALRVLCRAAVRAGHPSAALRPPPPGPPQRPKRGGLLLAGKSAVRISVDIDPMSLL